MNEQTTITIIRDAVSAARVFIFGSSDSSVWTQASCPKKPALNWLEREYLKREKDRVVKRSA